MSLYLMSVYYHNNESIVFQLVLDIVIWDCLLTQSLRPSVPQLCCSALTETIHVVMSLYLMSVYSIARSQLCFNFGCWLCKHETGSPSHIHLETSVSSCALWHSQIIHVGMSLTLMSVYSNHNESIVWDWVLDYVSMRRSPHTIHLETSVPQFSSSGTHMNQYK